MPLTQFLFAFRGRINRKPWWLVGFALFFVLITVVFAIFAAVVLTGHKGGLGSGGPMDFVMAVLYLMLGAANLLNHDPKSFVATPGLLFIAIGILLTLVLNVWVGLAIGAKRLHDRNKSAWWLLVFLLLPAVLERVGARMEGIGSILTLTAFAISVWAIVEMGFLRGTAGPNQYGPDPHPDRA
jgi:uncharacterized membrane protein YhaH (DUF805 family)